MCKLLAIDSFEGVAVILKTTFRSLALASAGSIAALTLLTATGVYAQQQGQPSNAPATNNVPSISGTQTGQGQTVAQIIAANSTNLQQLVQQLLPVVRSNPQAASEVIAAAQANPALATILAQALSRIQNVIAAQNPTAAAQIATIVAAAPPAFQAAYAVARAGGSGGPGGGQGPGGNSGPGGGDGGGGGGGGGSGGGGGGGGFGGFGGGSGGGVGGGVVSPSRP